MTDSYEKLKNEVLRAEHKIKLSYICDTTIAYKKSKNITNIYRYNEEEILNYIVNEVRQSLITDMSVEKYFDLVDVTNQCGLVSKTVFLVCNRLNIKCNVFKINPGYDNTCKLYNGGFHYFNIVIIGSKKYIVDCTYKQFFKMDRASLSRIGIPLITPPYPGIFMLLNEDRKKVAMSILKYGYVEATDENLKHYFDGFTISFRNGLYYENIGKAIYETDYTIDDYISFMETSDSQLNHENVKYLGFQKQPLNNYKFNFKVK